MSSLDELLSGANAIRDQYIAEKAAKKAKAGKPVPNTNLFAAPTAAPSPDLALDSVAVRPDYRIQHKNPELYAAFKAAEQEANDRAVQQKLDDKFYAQQLYKLTPAYKAEREYQDLKRKVGGDWNNRSIAGKAQDFMQDLGANLGAGMAEPWMMLNDVLRFAGTKALNPEWYAGTYTGDGGENPLNEMYDKSQKGWDALRSDSGKLAQMERDRALANDESIAQVGKQFLEHPDLLFTDAARSLPGSVAMSSVGAPAGMAVRSAALGLANPASKAAASTIGKFTPGYLTKGSVLSGANPLFGPEAQIASTGGKEIAQGLGVSAADALSAMAGDDPKTPGDAARRFNWYLLSDLATDVLPENSGKRQLNRGLGMLFGEDAPVKTRFVPDALEAGLTGGTNEALQSGVKDVGDWLADDGGVLGRGDFDAKAAGAHALQAFGPGAIAEQSGPVMAHRLPQRAAAGAVNTAGDIYKALRRKPEAPAEDSGPTRQDYHDILTINGVTGSQSEKPKKAKPAPAPAQNGVDEAKAGIGPNQPAQDTGVAFPPKPDEQKPAPQTPVQPEQPAKPAPEAPAEQKPATEQQKREDAVRGALDDLNQERESNAAKAGTLDESTKVTLPQKEQTPAQPEQNKPEQPRPAEEQQKPAEPEKPATEDDLANDLVSGQQKPAEEPAPANGLTRTIRGEDVDTRPAEGQTISQPTARATPAEVRRTAEVAEAPDYETHSTGTSYSTGAPVVSYGDVPKAYRGRTETVTAPNGKKVQAQYAVVEADQIDTTHDASGNINPNYSQTNGRVKVVAGNSDAAGIRAGYDSGTAGGYRADLAANAKSLGISPDAIAGMKKPVLVRLAPGKTAAPESTGGTHAPEQTRNGTPDQQRGPETVQRSAEQEAPDAGRETNGRGASETSAPGTREVDDVRFSKKKKKAKADENASEEEQDELADLDDENLTHGFADDTHRTEDEVTQAEDAEIKRTLDKGEYTGKTKLSGDLSKWADEDKTGERRKNLNNLLTLMSTEFQKHVVMANRDTKQFTYQVAINRMVQDACKKLGVDLTDYTNDLSRKILVQAVKNDLAYVFSANPKGIGWYDAKVRMMLRYAEHLFPSINPREAERALAKLKESPEPPADDTAAWRKRREAIAEAQRKLDDALNDRFVFMYLTAVTSNGQKVDQNLKMAVRGFRSWLASGRKEVEDVSSGTQAAGMRAAIQNLPKYAEMFGGLTKMRSFFMTKWTVGDLAKMGIAAGGESKDSVVRGATLIGPKIGNGFLANLAGFFDALTMDRWFMRTWGRMTGSLIRNNEKKLAERTDELKTMIRSLIESGNDGVIDAIKRETNMDFRELGKLMSDGKLTDSDLQHRAVRAAAALMPKTVRDRLKAEGTEYKDAADAILRVYRNAPGDKVAPAGGGERAYIRSVFNEALSQFADKDLTVLDALLSVPALQHLVMSDAQATLWYGEKKIYENSAFNNKQYVEDYSSTDAPDYANAMLPILAENGVSQSEIDAMTKEIEDQLKSDEADLEASKEEAERDRAEAEKAKAEGREPAKKEPKKFEDTHHGQHYRVNLANPFSSKDRYGSFRSFSLRNNRAEWFASDRKQDQWKNRVYRGKPWMGRESVVLTGRGGADSSSATDGGRSGVAGKSDGVLTVHPKQVWTAGRTLGEILGRSFDLSGKKLFPGATHPGKLSFYELSSSDAKVFEQCLVASKEGNRWGFCVDNLGEEYAGDNIRLFLSEDGLSGFAIKNGDDIVSVFGTEVNNTASKDEATTAGAGDSLMECAIAAGGRRLDCYNTILPDFYGAHGFVPVALVKFDPDVISEFNPSWDYKLAKKFQGGKPDIVFMVFDPSAKSAPAGKLVSEFRREVGYVNSYDDGTPAQMAAMQKLSEPYAEVEFRTSDANWRFGERDRAKIQKEVLDWQEKTRKAEEKESLLSGHTPVEALGSPEYGSPVMEKLLDQKASKLQKEANKGKDVDEDPDTKTKVKLNEEPQIFFSKKKRQPADPKEAAHKAALDSKIQKLSDAHAKAYKEGNTVLAEKLVRTAAELRGYGTALPEHAGSYSVRTKAAPKKTVKCFKVFTMGDGQLSALFVGGADRLPMKVWLDCNDIYHFTAKNGKPYVPCFTNPDTKKKGGGTDINLPDDPEVRRELHKRGYISNVNAKTVKCVAYRPGWHAGELPLFPQSGNKVPASQKSGHKYPNYHGAQQVVCEIEMDADKDWTDFAQSQKKAHKSSGELVPRWADLQHIPEGGFYYYTTNPLNAGKEDDTGRWMISDSIKINRVLSEDEVNRVLDENGKAHQAWSKTEKIADKNGKLRTFTRPAPLDLDALGYKGDTDDAYRKTLAPFTYDDDGKLIPLSERFNPEKNDIRFSKNEEPSEFEDKDSEVVDKAIAVEKDIDEAFGTGTVESMRQNGSLVTVATEKNLPSEIRQRLGDAGVEEGEVQGFYDPKTGRVYLIAENIDGNAAGVFLHEVGVHFVADPKNRALQRRALQIIRVGAKNGDPVCKEVLRRMREAGETSGEEGMAYLAEVYLGAGKTVKPIKGWFDQLRIAVKTWLNEHLAWVPPGLRLTDEDIVRIARSALEDVKNGRGPGGGSFRRKDTRPANRKDGASDALVAKRRKPVWGGLGKYLGLGRDELGRVEFKFGEQLVKGAANIALDVAEALIPALRVEYSVRGLSKEMRKAIRAMKAETDRAYRKVLEVSKTLGRFSYEERTMMSDFIEGRLRAEDCPDDVVATAQMLSTIMTGMTNELVKMGMLSPEAANRWRGHYLPRFYAKGKELTDINPFLRQFVPGRTARGIGGGSLKGRGNYVRTNVKDALYKLSAPDSGWELRTPGYTYDKQAGVIRDGEGKICMDTSGVTVWRDWTEAERQRMGEIRDAGYRFTIGYMEMQKDLALGHIFANIAGNPDWSSAYKIDDWVRVPDEEIPDTGGVKRYGKLAGMYVRPDILAAIAPQTIDQTSFSRALNKLMAYWKEGKTALNTVSHVNNVVGNFVMAHLAGVSITNAKAYYDAIAGIWRNSAEWQEAVDAGLVSGSFSQDELNQLLPPEFRKASRESFTKRGADAVMQVMSFGLRNQMRKAYEFEDSVFKYVIYLNARKQGLSVEDSVEYATRYIPTYDDIPGGARALRNLMPFFSWTYKTLPVIATSAAAYPWRLALPMVVINSLNMLNFAAAISSAGDDDDDWWEKLKKGKELSSAEEKLLPEYMQGSTIYGSPKFLRLGLNEATGLPRYWNISNFIPGGNFGDVTNQAGGLPWPEWLTPSHPLYAIYAAMFLNKDTFTGRDLVTKGDDEKDAAEKRAGWLYRQLMPALAVGGYHWDRIMDATASATGHEILGHTGINRQGQKVSPGTAVLNVAGFKVRDVDFEREYAYRQADLKKTYALITNEGKSVARMKANGAISADSADDRLADIRRKRDKVADEARENTAARDTIRRLAGKEENKNPD